MKATRTFATIVLLSLTCWAQTPVAAPKPAPPPPITEADAIAREKQLFAADEKHDLATVRSIIADDFVDIARDGSSIGKQQLLEEIPNIKLLRYAQVNFHLTPLGPHAYAISYESDATLLNAEGKEQRSHNILNSVWIWRDGCWQMLLHCRGVQLPTR